MNKLITTLVFLGLITYSQAIKLPDYWDKEYNNTWFYAGKDHIVNAAEWKEGDPCGFNAAVFETGTASNAGNAYLMTDDEEADFSEIT